ncbi:hypothetical protein U1Q18_030667 [Sarracenia purpurea var. burkii]
MEKMGKRDKEEELLKTLGDFTSKENWDNFFNIRGGDDSFEWYAEWPQLRDSLLSHLSSNTEPLPLAEVAASMQILVPGCGNSRLSEYLYDAGFRGITNIDFSKVVISDMLRRNVRSRPGMRWRVMDMTSMQVFMGSDSSLFSSYWLCGYVHACIFIHIHIHIHLYYYKENTQTFGFFFLTSQNFRFPKIPKH